MGKNYADFILDVSMDGGLLRELEQGVPFSTATAIVAWFSERGYSVSPGEAQGLLENQTALMDDADQVRY